MNAKEISTILSTSVVTKKYFAGIIPQDQLKTIKSNQNRTCFYVVNTDYSNQPGLHWTVIFLQSNEDNIDKDNKPEFFDSLANPPQVYGQNFTDFLIRNGPDYLISRKRIQSNRSSACGQFCIYYAFYRCLGVSMTDILNMFSWVQYLRNDIKARKFVNMMF